jgi:arsenite methyltransferase
MNSEAEVKQIVKDKYAEIAVADGKLSCCGSSSKVIDKIIMEDDYSKLDGYLADADLGLGCGIPTEHAGIEKGNTVVDLGSGAGNDVFVARSLVGDTGRVIGIDMTDEMIAKANRNKEKLKADNVDFRLGDIENMPVENSTADVVISNCVLNLVPDKQKAFSEIKRILKPGGHFCISDIVVSGNMPEGLKKSAEMLAGCVSGAIDKEEYLKIISDLGFSKVEVKKSKQIKIPRSVLRQYLTEDEVNTFNNGTTGIYSITVVGYKN